MHTFTERLALPFRVPTEIPRYTACGWLAFVSGRPLQLDIDLKPEGAGNALEGGQRGAHPAGL